MASLRQLVLVAVLAFLVLVGQDHGHGGPAGGRGPAIGAEAAAAPPARKGLVIGQQPQPLLSAAVAVRKRVLVPIPKSGPSTKWNSVVESGSGRRRTRAIVVGRRLGSV